MVTTIWPRVAALTQFRNSAKSRKLVPVKGALKERWKAKKIDSKLTAKGEAVVDYLLRGGTVQGVFEHLAGKSLEVKDINSFAEAVAAKLIDAGYEQNLVEVQIDPRGFILVHLDERIGDGDADIPQVLAEFGMSKLLSTPAKNPATGTFVYGITYKTEDVDPSVPLDTQETRESVQIVFRSGDGAPEVNIDKLSEDFDVRKFVAFDGQSSSYIVTGPPDLVESFKADGVPFYVYSSPRVVEVISWEENAKAAGVLEKSGLSVTKVDDNRFEVVIDIDEADAVRAKLGELGVAFDYEARIVGADMGAKPSQVPDDLKESVILVESIRDPRTRAKLAKRIATKLETAGQDPARFLQFVEVDTAFGGNEIATYFPNPTDDDKSMEDKDDINTKDRQDPDSKKAQEGTPPSSKASGDGTGKGWNPNPVGGEKENADASRTGGGQAQPKVSQQADGEGRVPNATASTTTSNPPRKAPNYTSDDGTGMPSKGPKSGTEDNKAHTAPSYAGDDGSGGVKSERKLPFKSEAINSITEPGAEFLDTAAHTHNKLVRITDREVAYRRVGAESSVEPTIIPRRRFDSRVASNQFRRVDSTRRNESVFFSTRMGAGKVVESLRDVSCDVEHLGRRRFLVTANKDVVESVIRSVKRTCSPENMVHLEV